MPANIPGVTYFFFHGQEGNLAWRCCGTIGNADQEYKLKQKYGLYQIPSLVRLLCLKNNVLEQSLANQVFKQNQICKVLQWESLNKKIIIASFASPHDSNQLKQANEFLINEQRLHQLFQQYLAAAT